ncbi:MAG: 50S ribosomal protein L29 [Aggregatilineales bacterium]
MDVREIRQMSDSDLLDAVEDKKEELFNLRFQKASGQLENTNIVGNVKRDIARLYTVLNERNLAALVAGEEE